MGDSEKKVHEIPARDTYCFESRYAIKKLDSSPLGYATTPLTASAPKKPTGLLMPTITKSFVPFSPDSTDSPYPAGRVFQVKRCFSSFPRSLGGRCLYLGFLEIVLDQKGQATRFHVSCEKTVRTSEEITLKSIENHLVQQRHPSCCSVFFYLDPNRVPLETKHRSSPNNPVSFTGF